MEGNDVKFKVKFICESAKSTYQRILHNNVRTTIYFRFPPKDVSISDNYHIYQARWSYKHLIKVVNYLFDLIKIFCHTKKYGHH